MSENGAQVLRESVVVITSGGLTGPAEAFVMDDNILAGNIANSKNPAGYKIVGEVLSVEPIAIMFKRDDAGLK